MKGSKFTEARVAFAIKPAGAVALCWGFVDSFLPAAGRDLLIRLFASSLIPISLRSSGRRYAPFADLHIRVFG